jgi:glycosyltransferase involved in cell wall biosynthesis
MSPAVRPQTSGVRRIAVIAHAAESLVRFRGPLIREIAERRHRVLAIAPDLEPGAAEDLERRGVETAHVVLEPADAGLLGDRRTAKAVLAQLQAFAPHIVLSSGPRSAVFGAIAGRKAGAHTVLMVNGLAALGLPLAPNNTWLGNRAARWRAKAALAAADVVVFHNVADRAYLVAAGLLGSQKKSIVQPGSGVDLERWAQAPLPPVDAGLVFLMAGRLARSTGADTFAIAAALVKSQMPRARFLLAGPRGHGADGLTASDLDNGAFEYLGPLDDIQAALAAAHVFVYPSHWEGMPGGVLEAMSVGRPIITTNTPGCRDTVDERVNGCLVPFADPEALAEAMQSFLRRPELIPAMARASRMKAERRFDQRPVVAELMAVLGLAG